MYRRWSHSTLPTLTKQLCLCSKGSRERLAYRSDTA
ncbi:hypothetical protein [Escherichia phage Ecp_YSF]|nr:hypothetical protein [Escherichia phage Ecp_YSF]